MLEKSRGQRDYEADVARHPQYHDGTPRKTWDQLDYLARWTWERCQPLEEWPDGEMHTDICNARH